MAVFAAIATLAIRGEGYHHEVARGLEDNQSQKPTLSLWILARKPALLVTGLTLLLFHLANAALLPMLSMRVASSTGPDAVDPGLYAAATVVISQLVMIPVAIYVSRRVDKIGYRYFDHDGPVNDAASGAYCGRISRDAIRYSSPGA